MSTQTTRWARAAGLVLVAAGVTISTCAADHVNPNQAAIDALNDKKALVDAQESLAKSEATLAKDQSPAFDSSFGKTGSLTVETGERDKFHVTARSAEAFRDAAKQLAQIIQGETKPVALLTDADRNAVPYYWAAKVKLDRLTADVNSLIGSPPSEPAKEAFGTELLGVGSLLSQVSQFTQLFRTNKSIAYDDSLLPDELLLDLVAVEAREKVLYPAGALDSLATGNMATQFGRNLEAVFKRRTAVATVTTSGKKEKVAALLADMDTLAASLATPDATTKIPALMTVMRGELVDQYLRVTEGRSFSVKIAVKGGASLKTSSIWRSDRLYASGGVVATYRLTSGGANPTVLKAGVITSETKFVRVQLD